MIVVLAHAGHWLVQLAYLAPLVLLVAVLVANQLRERRERQRAQEADGAHEAGAGPDPEAGGPDSVSRAREPGVNS